MRLADVADALAAKQVGTPIADEGATAEGERSKGPPGPPERDG